MKWDVSREAVCSRSSIVSVNGGEAAAFVDGRVVCRRSLA